MLTQPAFRIANGYFAPVNATNGTSSELAPQTGVARFRWYFPIVPIPATLSGIIYNETDAAAYFQVLTGRDWDTASTLTAVNVYFPSSSTLGAFAAATPNTVGAQASCPFFFSATAAINITTTPKNYLDIVTVLASSDPSGQKNVAPVKGRIKLVYSIGEMVEMPDAYTEIPLYTAPPTGGG